MRKRAALLLLSLLAAAAIITFNPVSAVSGDSWMTKAPMQQARAYLGVAVVNEKKAVIKAREEAELKLSFPVIT